MKTVKQLAEEIVDREGGYVNDPDDPGGATNRGVTIHTARRLGLDLDGDGDVDEYDVQQITRDMAVRIFTDQYFRAPKIHMLPEALRPTVFDMQVNSGSNAVRILQRVLRDRGHNLVVDGAVGPHTAGAAHRAYDEEGAALVDAYGIARRDYYYRIGDRRPASRKYARRRDGGKGGWIKRAEKFISPTHHLTDEEHRQRVAGWE